MSVEVHARAKEIFLRALELPASGRQTFIDGACGDDGELRREVASLLAHHHAETLIAARSDTSPIDARTSTGQTAPSRRLLAFLVRLRPQARLALMALAAIIALSAIGGWVHHGTETTLRQILSEKLRGMLDADVEAVELWIESKKSHVRQWSVDRTVAKAAMELVEVEATHADAAAKFRKAPAQTALRSRMEQLAHEPPNYLLWARTQTVVADSSSDEAALGRLATPLAAKLLSYVFHGETILCIERPSEPLIRGLPAPSPAPLPAIICPIETDDGRIVAALMLRDIDRGGELDRILGHVKTGDTGECYAFDREGIMLSDSRFDDDLVRLGIIPSDAGRRSATVVSLRDPGGDLMAGYRPRRPLAACPLTNMAAHAVAGENGIDLDGYRDYRGVTVIGAWRWLPKYSFGMAIEIDRWEAFAPLKFLDVAFGGTLAVLAVLLAAVVISWIVIARLKREAIAGRLGQYTLEEMIGEGGMGQVYRARHSLLKRPTAVKVLKPQSSTPEMLARFEQEVQLSSQLTHPNTIEIYDYGCTPEGVFYYAMEYIDGLNLAQVVALAGPLPAARVVQILRQICGSLREAHSLGLLHRDIKPQNIMLCSRGGEADVVKVLDFGLAKQMATDTSHATASTLLAGTPLYMSPERLLDPHAVDARCDIYSVGAVGFKLLTGEDIFAGQDTRSLLAQIVELPPPRPSDHTGNAIPRELDDLIVRCLGKQPADRPASAAQLLEVLDHIGLIEIWTQAQAFEWWQRQSI